MLLELLRIERESTELSLKFDRSTRNPDRSQSLREYVPVKGLYFVKRSDSWRNLSVINEFQRGVTLLSYRHRRM